MLLLLYNSADITLRQMASQLSGLPREAPCENATSENVCQESTEDILKSLSSQMLIHPPWTKPSYRYNIYVYNSACIYCFFNQSHMHPKSHASQLFLYWNMWFNSNLAYALLGRLMVRQVDKDTTFEDYVKRAIIDPLDLKNTGFKITEE